MTRGFTDLVAYVVKPYEAIQISVTKQLTTLYIIQCSIIMKPVLIADKPRSFISVIKSKCFIVISVTDINQAPTTHTYFSYFVFEFGVLDF